MIKHVGPLQVDLRTDANIRVPRGPRVPEGPNGTMDAP